MSDKPRCEHTYANTAEAYMRCSRQAFYHVTDLFRPGTTIDTCAKHLSDTIEELRAEAPGGGEYMPLLVRRIRPDGR